MDKTVAAAEQERDERKSRLETSIHQLEKRVRSELDWRHRLSNDGARIVVLTLTSVSVVLTLIAVKKILGRNESLKSPNSSDAYSAMGYDDLLLEIQDLQKQVKVLSKKKKKGLGSTIVLRIAAAGGAALGTQLAKKFITKGMSRSDEEQVFGDSAFGSE